MTEALNLGLWGIFVLVGLCTLLPRSSFIVAGSGARLPPAVQRALRYAPAAALAALITPDLLPTQAGAGESGARLLAAAVVVAVVLRWRNPWLPFLAGMATLMLLLG